MKSPVLVLPAALEALNKLAKEIEAVGVPRKTLELLSLRASQINGCAVCLDMHSRWLTKHGESSERIFTVAGWREAPYFTDAERAALALTEAVTRIADKGDPVPDEIWNEAARHFDEKALSAILLSLGLINVYNRINVATRSLTGPWIEQYI